MRHTGYPSRGLGSTPPRVTPPPSTVPIAGDGLELAYGRLLDSADPLYLVPCPSIFDGGRCDGRCTVWFTWPEIEAYEEFGYRLVMQLRPPGDGTEPFVPRLGPECCERCAEKISNALQVAADSSPSTARHYNHQGETP